MESVTSEIGINSGDSPSSPATLSDGDAVTASVSKQNAPSANESKKRKAVSATVNLNQFIKILWRAFLDLKINSRAKELIIPSSFESYLVEETTQLPTKISKHRDIDPEFKAREIATKDSAETATHGDYKLQNKRSIFMTLVLRLFSDFEKANVNFQFQKEHLKYFLATHSRFVKPNDFLDTNKLVKQDKKNKSGGQLINGGILVEYVKSLDLFASNLSRSDKEDVKALRFIVENGIEISPKIYKLVGNLIFKDADYREDEKDTKRDDYVRIQISNFKRSTVLITNCLTMIYDGFQFILPPSSIEKDLQTNMIMKASLCRDEYVLLDVLMSTKNKVLDIIGINIKGRDLPTNYFERLKLINELFANVKTVTAASGHIETSYIQKKKEGVGISYIYYKPNLTVAVIGTFEKHACLAFRSDDGLVYKLKSNISGPTASLIGTSVYKSNKETPLEPTNGLLTINLNNVKVKVDGIDSNNINLFENAIPVELKDSNKLGNISRHKIAHISEYKLPTTSKENALFESMKQLFNNPSNVDQIVLLLAKSTALKDIQEKLSSLNQEITINTGDYGK